MPQVALSVALIALVGLLLLVPPLAFARALGRYYRRSNTGAGILARLLLGLAGFLPFAVNIGYMSLAWPALREARLVIDQNLGVAIIVAWAAFWGRLALGRKGRHLLGHRQG